MARPARAPILARVRPPRSWGAPLCLGFALTATSARAEEPPVAAFPDVVEIPPQPPPPPGPSAPTLAPAPAPPPMAPPVALPPAAPPPVVADEPETERRGYGGQTLLVDGVSLGLILLASDESSGGALAAVGGLGYLLGPPFVHAAHGHAGKTFASFGLRVALPLAGGFVGCAAEGDSSGEYGCLGGAAVGLGLGIIGAIILDAAVIANEDVPRETPRRPEARLRLFPRLTLTGQRGELGVLGRF